MEWTVFEVNDSDLWGKIIRNTTDFLKKYDRREVRNGALINPVDPSLPPFFVQCDASLNPPGATKVKVRYGLCIVETAEQIIFESSLWDGGAEVTP